MNYGNPTNPTSHLLQSVAPDPYASPIPRPQDAFPIPPATNVPAQAGAGVTKLNLEGIANFPALVTPKAFRDTGKPYYSILLTIPKTDTAQITAIRGAIEAALQNNAINMRAKTGNQLEQSRYPLKDGDVLGKDGRPRFPNHWYLNTKNGMPVRVFARANQSEINASEVLAGNIVMVCVNFSAYSEMGEGVSAWLNSVLKIGEGEPIGFRSDPEADFPNELARANLQPNPHYPSAEQYQPSPALTQAQQPPYIPPPLPQQPYTPPSQPQQPQQPYTPPSQPQQPQQPYTPPSQPQQPQQPQQTPPPPYTPPLY